jgi:hypothetical protein
MTDWLYERWYNDVLALCDKEESGDTNTLANKSTRRIHILLEYDI